MGAWDYELARELRSIGRGGGGSEILEGTVAAVSPLKIALLGGEVMAPPAPLAVPEHLPGYTVSDHALEKLEWAVGDRVCCCWMGKTVVVLGRLPEDA